MNIDLFEINRYKILKKSEQVLDYVFEKFYNS